MKKISLLWFLLISMSYSSLANYPEACVILEKHQPYYIEINYNDDYPCNRSDINSAASIFLLQEGSSEQDKSILMNYSKYLTPEETSLITFAYGIETHQNFRDLKATPFDRVVFEGSGSILSEMANRQSVKLLINFSESKYIEKQDYPYIKKWFTTALENNPYETMVALRKIYKDDMYFHDENVERYLKNLYQEALSKY